MMWSVNVILIFFENRTYFENIADMIVFTGAIDEFLSISFWKIRVSFSLCLKKKNFDCSNYQGNAVINYTEQNIPTQGLLSINILNVLEMK